MNVDPSTQDGGYPRGQGWFLGSLRWAPARLSQYEKLEGWLAFSVWDEKNTLSEFPLAKSKANILGLCPSKGILAIAQIACLLANVNNVQIKPPAPVELI
jgi:hypothetical protein